ncbi:MAG TPA: hypothetical protein VHT27_02010 [Solirubrobacteraceae bacterium]|nr:hypothetical protein [Solirubrobacteraceae bacterium]
MAKRSSRRSTPRGARSGARSRTAQRQAPAAGAVAERPADSAPRAEKRARRRAHAAAQSLAEQTALGERPQAPWHPLPLSELLIFVGLIGVVVGAIDKRLVVVGVGIGAVLIGTLDFSIREHLSGYRPHTTMLAAAPTALLHGAIAIGMLALHAPSPSYVIAPIVIDVPVFMALFRALRARFRDARHERVLAAGR